MSDIAPSLEPAAADRGYPKHSIAYRMRRFVNWFLLGLTYATFYMGRYNLNVVKPHMEKLFFHGSQTELGVIGFWGAVMYAGSELVNGPLADKIGGRRAIILGAFGAATFNLIMGFVFFGGVTSHLVLIMSALYAVNMIFQSFGAMSVVKVNAPWFHVNERGVFGGVFGIMISLGYVLAFSTAGWVLHHPHIVPWYFTFIVPAIAISIMLVLCWLFVRDKPSEAGFEDFSTADASDGDDTPVDYKYIFKKVFSNRILLTIMAAEFCTGMVREGLFFYFPDWLKKVHHLSPGGHLWGWVSIGITIGGIVGGLIAGFISDKFFQSRRPPAAFIFYVIQIPAIIALTMVHSQVLAVAGIGFACTWIFGVHGMLSGTASMDFGGKKGAASAAGMLDGIQYVAMGVQALALGILLDHFGWWIWTWTIVPFSVIGAIIMLRLWNEKPHGASRNDASAPAPEAA